MGSLPDARTFLEARRADGTLYAGHVPMRNQVEALQAAYNRAEIVKVIENWFVSVTDGNGNAEKVGPMTYETAARFQEIVIPLRSVTDVVVWRDGDVVPEA